MHGIEKLNKPSDNTVRDISRLRASWSGRVGPSQLQKWVQDIIIRKLVSIRSRIQKSERSISFKTLFIILNECVELFVYDSDL